MNSGSKRSVFISHASTNLKLATEIVEILESVGVSCWIAPRDIPPGQKYGEIIIDGIQDCSIVLFLLTDESNLSDGVAKELERAFNYQKIIVPVRLKNISPSRQVEYYVSGAQWVDAFASPLRDRLTHVAAIVRAIESGEQRPAVPTESRSIGNSLRRMGEVIKRNPLPYGLAFGAFFMVAGFIGAVVHTWNGLMDEGRAVEQKAVASICRTAFPLLPDGRSCTLDDVTRSTNLSSKFQALFGETWKHAATKNDRFRRQIESLNKEFNRAKPRGDFQQMEALIAELSKLSASQP